ncbi:MULTISPECIES: type II toxin-antitoxin system HicB family antitoxin [unclassified Wenzhouxiangella]|uniref:type II toxin-antitoxin system HicB family antitoxin n=1 Tax=unclassified Wenzhouxiangella TaxID=2613841 RepID=UPI000E32C21B|nr:MULTISPECIES: type II toxin-antitoxin system HicB family antitoxin [unclassified Wenzhouxiangella]RFF28331.1 type II toxin-antitoxin system HicB family antitoxin [Wenzhouxiangella sp. 15181]RFP67743.1 type II toxin-antitoxin system HicB family antitoxin [Wenzhouxiangella sp. 15190]
MRYVYPVTLERDEDGRFVALARDVPEAMADGETFEGVCSEMSDALGAALAGYSLEGRGLPEPSAEEGDEVLIPVSPLVAAKLSLREVMRQKGIRNTELARLIGVSEGAVRRLVDPDHSSRLDRVVAALDALGHHLIIEDQPRRVA